MFYHNNSILLVCLSFAVQTSHSGPVTNTITWAEAKYAGVVCRALKQQDRLLTLYSAALNEHTWLLVAAQLGAWSLI